MRLRFLATLSAVVFGVLLLTQLNTAQDVDARTAGCEDQTKTKQHVVLGQWYELPIQASTALLDSNSIRIAGVNSPSSIDMELIITAVGGTTDDSVVEIKSVGSSYRNPNRVRLRPISQLKPVSSPDDETRSAIGVRKSTPVVEAASAQVTGDERPSRTFTIPILTDEGRIPQDSQLTCLPIFVSDNIAIYADDRVVRESATLPLAEKIADVLERIVMPEISQTIGPYLDIDSSGRLTVVLSPDVHGFTRGKNRVKGFVQPTGYFPEANLGGASKTALRYEDVIFLDTNLPTGDTLTALLAHEFTHIASLSNAHRVSDSMPAVWINEAIAHFGETLCSQDDTNYRHRVNSFLFEPNRSPLLLEEAGDDEFWRSPGVRGASFSFLNWCVERCGVELLRELTLQPGNAVGHLEMSTGLSFGELVQQWGMSLVESESQPVFTTLPAAGRLPSTIRGNGNLFVRTKFVQTESSKHRLVRIDVPQDKTYRVAVRFLK